MSDTLNIPGPELMRRIDAISDQLEEAIGGLEEAMKLVIPADNEAKAAVIVTMERSVSMIEQALDHLDVAVRFAAGKGAPDDP